MNIVADGLDIASYFKRIGFDGTPAPTLETLKALHLLHPLQIPFENLDPFVGRPVLLDMAALQAKLVHSRRGGYCYEQNLLFMQVLTAIGFSCTGLAARVLWNRPDGALTARTHMLIRIDLEDGPWIADVGFGGITLTAPLLLQEGIEQETPHETFRLVKAGEYFVLEALIGAEWRPVYRFGLEDHSALDYEITNYFLSNNPQSQFVHLLMAARPTREGRYTLLNNRLSFHGTTSEKKELASAAEIEQALTEIFGIDILPGLAEAIEREGLVKD
jgi:N-hydroxyarylamine O-acetyltransferase